MKWQTWNVQYTENLKILIYHKCALEQVQIAVEQFGRSDTKHLCYMRIFRFSSVPNATFFPTSQTNILLFLFIILGYNNHEKVCLYDIDSDRRLVGELYD